MIPAAHNLVEGFSNKPRRDLHGAFGSYAKLAIAISTPAPT
jgi:hypothetical protein